VEGLFESLLAQSFDGPQRDAMDGRR
jgi:hypothetical protein